MRTLSMWEPWATLVAKRLKLWETRSWDIKPPLLLAIQAAKRPYNPAEVTVDFRAQILQDGIDGSRLQTAGCVVCFVYFSECRKTEEVRGELSERELLYGCYDAGRYAWYAKAVWELPRPVPVKGHQGIFHWKEGDEVFASLGGRDALKAATQR